MKHATFTNLLEQLAVIDGVSPEYYHYYTRYLGPGLLAKEEGESGRNGVARALAEVDEFEDHMDSDNPFYQETIEAYEEMGAAIADFYIEHL